MVETTETKTPLKFPTAGRGEWDDEPDRLDFVASECDCTLRRGPFGAWCGYVKVPVGHILHGVEYSARVDELNEALERRKEQPIGDNPGFVVMMGALCGSLDPSPGTVLQVHGGITYSASGPAGEENNGEWWYGFYCAHCDDYAPKHPSDLGFGRPVIYRNMAYVRKETENLAAQIVTLGVAAAGGSQKTGESMSINYDLLPSGLSGGVRRYIEHGIPPGDFLLAVIRNDLAGALACADDANREQLHEIVRFFWDEAPSTCWGSKEKMGNWLARFDEEATEQTPNP